MSDRLIPNEFPKRKNNGDIEQISKTKTNQDDPSEDQDESFE